MITIKSVKTPMSYYPFCGAEIRLQDFKTQRCLNEFKISGACQACLDYADKRSESIPVSYKVHSIIKTL